MKKRNILFLLPAAIAPYAVISVLLFIFFSTEGSFFSKIMNDVFHNNGLLPVGLLFLFVVLAFILSAISSILSICKKYDASALAKTAIIIKLIQIPAYICIFILSILFLITIWTFAISIMLFFIDCLMLIMTGLISIASVAVAIREKYTSINQSWWVIALQFIFCLDVIATIIFYASLKKKYSEIKESDV